MMFTTKRYDGKEYRVYRCGRYANNGTRACSIHTISLEELKAAVLFDIRRQTESVIRDESAMLDELTRLGSQKQRHQLSEYRTKLRSLHTRLAEIDRLAQNLFEEKVSGTVPPDMCNRMLAKYETERVELHDNVAVLESEISEMENQQDNAASFVELVKRYVHVEDLDREIVVELIDNIVISERYKQDGVKQQDIKIKYKFIGELSKIA